MNTQQQDSEHDSSHRSQQYRRTETGVLNDRVKRTGGLLIGTALLLRGLRRRSVRGVVMALVGAGILIRTLGGDTVRERIDSDRLLHSLPEGDQLLDSLPESDRLPDSIPKGDETPETSVSRSVTIGESADEVYEAWRDPEVFSQIMGDFAEVTSTDEDHYQWSVHGPADVELSWETQVVEAEPGELVRWETPDDASVPNSGSVRFRPAPDDRGTVVTLSLDFDPPGGTLGNAVVNQLDVVPETLAGHALGRFKSLVESGEIPTLEGNPSGRGKGDLL